MVKGDMSSGMRGEAGRITECYGRELARGARRAGWWLGVGAVVLAASGRAGAEPQWNAAVRAGVRTGQGSEGERGSRFVLGVQGDMLLGMSAAGQWGAGPAVKGWSDFEGWGLGGGGSLVVPVVEDFPVTLTGGVQWRAWGSEGEPQAFGEVLWGTRTYNYHGSYEMAAGIGLGGAYGFGEQAERAVTVTVQVDGEALLLPVLLVVGAVRGD